MGIMAQRTTLTLQDDVYQAARAEAERSGLSLRDVINDALRRGLVHRPAAPDIRLRTFSSAMRMEMVNTGDILEAIEGPEHR